MPRLHPKVRCRRRWLVAADHRLRFRHRRRPTEQKLLRSKRLDAQADEAKHASIQRIETRYRESTARVSGLDSAPVQVSAQKRTSKQPIVALLEVGRAILAAVTSAPITLEVPAPAFRGK